MQWVGFPFQRLKLLPPPSEGGWGGGPATMPETIAPPGDGADAKHCVSTFSPTTNHLRRKTLRLYPTTFPIAFLTPLLSNASFRWSRFR